MKRPFLVYALVVLTVGVGPMAALLLLGLPAIAVVYFAAALAAAVTLGPTFLERLRGASGRGRK